ncbi:hypothetical protein FEM48_Zijuj05G0029500 [Ziziphus jujuba var. spinosa]|uniref:Protein EARLY RESPONSIVE TO DEHYDRATION 15-like n=1 Tax=Ziziphus jujuba var. spinosa TaxID=714518 RepID=A0A978VCF0_ZIZJJ|nr:hypothetical protein FEM48_Zijuj05G0029500 [Ziziphus jujuba var. spinosa]
MALVAGRSSSLNPNAPLFVPAAFRQVEDFSPEWWELVKTSAWFHEYWLSQHPEDEFDGSADAVDVADMIPETFVQDDEVELAYLEVELEELALSSEAKGKTDLADSDKKNGRMPTNGLEMDARTILKDLTVTKSPKERGPRSPRGPAKYREKAVQYVSPKCSPRRIQQPR